MEQKLTHIDGNGNAWMVDVGDKAETDRTAIACGKIFMSREALDAVVYDKAKKGDVLGVARVAGIMAAKKTSDFIPLCHTLALTKCSVEFEIMEEEQGVKAFCLVKTYGRTGVEMEALTGVSAALLTVYDMLKAIDRSITITDICLLKKEGGKSGMYNRGGAIVKPKNVSHP